MSIRTPPARVPASEKRLLILLARLLADETNSDGRTNLAQGHLVLSDGEAEELAGLLEALLSDREFVEGASFVEEISRPEPRDEWRLREVFLSGRRRVPLASIHWNDFQLRLGIRPTSNLDAIRPMSFEHFVELERELLVSRGLSAHVTEIVVRLLAARRAAIERTRRGSNPIAQGTLVYEITETVHSLRSRPKANTSVRKISAQRLAGIVTVVADGSVLFTTLDWGVAGTISTMAGALVLAVKAD